MTADDLLNLLGERATHAGVLAALAEFGISSRPSLEPPENPNDEPDWYNWLLSGRDGIEFGFVDPAYLLARRPSLRGTVPLVLAQLYFYGRHPGVAPYQGDLPFGLSLSDSRAEVRRKLHRFEPVRRSYVRDVWDLPRYRMIVAYVPGVAGVASILCMLRLSPWPAGEEESFRLPRLDQVIDLFGQPWHSAAFRRIFSPFGVESFTANIALRGVADFRYSYGFELYFSVSETADVAKGIAHGDRVFSAIKLFRDRHLDAFGWKGELPYDIRFDDPQSELFRKVVQAPDQTADHDLAGFALWHFPRFSLHLLYSNLANLLLAATIMQPGYWVSAEGC
jgi:hypothetical protein